MKLIKNTRIYAFLITTGACLTAGAQFTLPGINTTVGIASTLQSINANTAAMLEAKNQANRAVLRGTRLSEPVPGQGGIDPANTGGQPELGGEAGRSQSGRPPMVNPLPGAGEGENTEVDDPFANNPNGGAGEGENTEVDDPFANDPDNGSGGSENSTQNVYYAPNGKPFPSHWGAPPAIQTRDLRELPGGFGSGSGTLANWIQENLDRDAGPTSGGNQTQVDQGAVCRIVVYGTSWCGYCTKTRDLFKAQGVTFLDKDIEKDAEARGVVAMRPRPGGGAAVLRW